MPDKQTMAAQEAETRHEKRWVHAGQVLGRAEDHAGASGVWLQAIRVKLPQEKHGETMIVLTGSTAEGPVVAFHRGDGSAEALAGALNRFHNGALKWKEDQYAK